VFELSSAYLIIHVRLLLRRQLAAKLRRQIWHIFNVTGCL